MLKADPVSEGDCRGLANYTITTTAPVNQYYDVPDTYQASGTHDR